MSRHNGDARFVRAALSHGRRGTGQCDKLRVMMCETEMGCMREYRCEGDCGTNGFAAAGNND